MCAARFPVWTCGLLLALAGLPAIAQGTLTGAQRAALRLWRSDYPRHCLLLGGANAEAPDVARLERLVAYLEGEATLAAPLLDVARREAVPICLDDGCRGLFGYYDVTNSWIGVRSDLSFAEQALTLVHELRHLDQTVRGYGRSLDYAMSEAARLTCAAEADVQAVTALFAWRLRVAGDWGPWIALSASEHDADLAARFAAVAGAGAGELAAASATFDRWYASAWRTGTYRRNACSDHLDRLDERHAIPSYAPLPDDYFEGFCVLPSGRAYDCAPPRCSAGRGGARPPAPRERSANGPSPGVAVRRASEPRRRRPAPRRHGLRLEGEGAPHDRPSAPAGSGRRRRRLALDDAGQRAGPAGGVSARPRG